MMGTAQITAGVGGAEPSKEELKGLSVEIDDMAQEESSSGARRRRRGDG
jgi:hypothetical protein